MATGLDLGRLAQAGNVAGNGAPAANRTPAMVWLNLGYPVDVTNDQGEVESRFVSLPVGIPVDTMEHIELRGRNQDFLQFTKRRNELAQAIQDAGKKLAPGEDTIINGLQLQLRRIATPVTDADVSTEDSRYGAPPISFGAPTPAAAEPAAAAPKETAK